MKPRVTSMPPEQRGAATLVVVMVLFLVMALLAAYANRSLLFEQRVSSNFYRASASLEAAEAGIEWTLAQLNGTAVDDTCQPVAAGGTRFADRYLAIAPADRRISYKSADTNGIVDCARNVGADGWSCRCPAANVAHTARPAIAGGEQSPSFGIEWISSGTRGGTFTVTMVGCTTSTLDTCRGAQHIVSNQQVSKNKMFVTLGFVSAVRTPPATPLVVRGSLNSAGAGLGLHNTDPRSAGMLAALGGDWTGMVDGRLESVPGTSASQAVVRGDTSLQNAADADAVFKMFMGANNARYQQHPALRKLSCNGDCTDVIDAAYQAGIRMIWIDGPLTISSNRVIGSTSDPVLIIASGDVTLDGPFELTGMLATLGGLSWTNASSSPSVIHGMVLVGSTMQTDGRMDINYRQLVADTLRNRVGSFVRVPGGWIDNQDL